MTEIPATRQSIYETMSCPHSYGLIHIQGQKPPDTTQSVRGRDIHAIRAAYSEHCAARRVSMDLAYLEQLQAASSDEVVQIMDTTEESITVDWQNFFGAEISMGLTEDFLPTYSVTHEGEILPPHPIWNFSPNETWKPTAYSAILDDIALFPGGRTARIKDYKSHPRAFEPTTFQAKLYSLMLFMHLPELQEVEFVLVFVRYANVARPIKFYRDQVPELKEEARRVRARQKELHATYLAEGIEALPALSGTHCTYCPAVQDFSCPIAKLNPMLNLTPEERLRFRLWYAAASRANNQVLSQHLDGNGGEPIVALDGNGNPYTFGPVPKQRTTFPLFVWDGAQFSTPIVEALQDWMYTDAQDVLPNKRSPEPWPTKLRIGATELNRYIKAKKREVVHNSIKDLAHTDTEIEYCVTKAAEVDDGQEETQREDQAGNPVGAGAWEP